jgi:enoyl-CoA hydratase/carnithine racemase
MDSYTTIKLDIDGPIATLTLNRPERLNAFTVDMQRDMNAAFDRIDADDAVRAVIVTGAGRAFCAGADLASGTDTFRLASGEETADAGGKTDYSHPSVRDWGGLLTLRIFKCLKPVIAAINGPAVGIGATMTLAMDVRLASTEARIGFVFLRRGLVPEAASSWFLPRLVGISKALEWCYTGQVYPASEMHEAGLIRSLHRPEELLPAARALALSFAEATAPVSVALTRQMLWRGLGWSHPMEAHKVDSRGIAARGRANDVIEGVNSFLEKRAPHFSEKVSQNMPDFYPWWNEPEYE